MVSLTHNVVLQSKGFRKQEEGNKTFFCFQNLSLVEIRLILIQGFLKYHLTLAFCFHKKYPNKQTLAFIDPKMGGPWGWGVVVQKKRSCTWKTGQKD